MAQHMTEAARLNARLAAAPGLVDVRFVLTYEPGTTVEGVCHDANAMLDAFERGDATPLSFNDSRRAI